MKRIFLKIGSIVTVLVIAGMVMVGCQKEMEDEMIIQIEKKDDFKSRVRLKSGSEGAEEDAYTYSSFVLSNNNTNKTVTVQNGKYYKIEIKGNGFSSTVKLTGNGYSKALSANSSNYYVGSDYIYIQGDPSHGQNIKAEFNGGNAGAVTFYEYY